MKNIKKIYLIAAVLSLVVIFGFTLIQNQDYNMTNTALQDSLNTPRRGGMMGNGMMGGGMMRGRMMGRGMMEQSGANNNKTDKNGNWVAPAAANRLTNPLKNISKASRKGQNIFNSQCFTCHGTDGKGDGPAAISLHPKPANLTSARVQRQSDGAIFWKITNGNSPMPSFESGLSKNQRWELVDYIRQLGK